MKDYAQLTYRGQVSRLRRLAEVAVEAYGLSNATLQLIAHEENTTFRLRGQGRGASTSRYEPNEYLLRIHRPGKHGDGIQAERCIASELMWLEALRRDADLAVPEPLLTTQGGLTTTASAPGVPQPRVCTVLRWMQGVRYRKSARPAHIQQIGRATAQLHDHGTSWRQPEAFSRKAWDWNTFFGDGMDFGGITADQTFELLPARHRSTFERVAEHMRVVMTELVDDRDAYGLIHGDLHLDNVLFRGREPRVIDFDDCGEGYLAYDIAVGLWGPRMRDDYPRMYEAYRAGYEAVRPLPRGIDHLESFIAARDVSVGLWQVGMAQTNPAFRDGLAAELAAIDEFVSNDLDLPGVF